MYAIKTLNSISDAIYNHLPKERYNVSSDETNPAGILVRSASCHEMAFNEELLAIARAGAGVNNIPLDRCTQEGIVVFNTPGANANAVKELVFGAMLMVTRNIDEAIKWCATLKGQGAEVPKLVEKGKSQFVGHEVKGKRMGVIGLGAIGVMVANTARAIGMSVAGYDPFISVEHAWGLSRAVERAHSLEQLLASSDYISIHVPLMDKTRGYLNAQTLAHAKTGAILMNFSRAELVQVGDVIAALEEGKLGRYITDFPVDELIGAKNVVCIPHLGASTPESEENCANMAAAQLKEYLENGNIVNSVNMPTCELPRSGAMRVALVHKNTTNMVGQIAGVLANKGVNIANMINKSKSDVAYTLLDLDEKVNGDVFEQLKGIGGMIRVRVL